MLVKNAGPRNYPSTRALNCVGKARNGNENFVLEGDDFFEHEQEAAMLTKRCATHQLICLLTYPEPAAPRLRSIASKENKVIAL